MTRFPRLDSLILAIKNWRYQRGQRISWEPTPKQVAELEAMSDALKASMKSNGMTTEEFLRRFPRRKT